MLAALIFSVPGEANTSTTQLSQKAEKRVLIIGRVRIQNSHSETLDPGRRKKMSPRKVTTAPRGLQEILPRILTGRACGVNIAPEAPHMQTLGLPKSWRRELGRKKTRGPLGRRSFSTEHGRVLRRAFDTGENRAIWRACSWLSREWS